MGAGASVESLNINGLAEVRTAGIARIPAHMALRILPLFQAAEAKGMPSIVTDTIRNNEIDGSKALALNADTIDDLTKNDPDRMELKVALRSIQDPDNGTTMAVPTTTAAPSSENEPRVARSYDELAALIGPDVADQVRDKLDCCISPNPN